MSRFNNSTSQNAKPLPFSHTSESWPPGKAEPVASGDSRDRHRNFYQPTSASISPTSAPESSQSVPPLSAGASAGEKRVALACHRCRAKRGRCSGDKPVCKSCAKANEECIWPSGRKRKRTRREMEADERRERDDAASRAAGAANHNHAVVAVGGAHAPASIPTGHPGVTGLDVNGSLRRTYGLAPDGAPVDWGTGSQPQRPMNGQDVEVVNGMAGGSNLEWQYPKPAGYTSYIWPPSQSQPHASPNTMQHASPASSASFGLGSEHQTEQIVKAMESQVAFIEGDPSRQEDLELFYYRFSGSTAIRPGINRISLKLHPRTTATNGTLRDSGATAPLPSTADCAPDTPPPDQDLFEPNGMPYPHIHQPLLDTFFRTMGRHFPSVSKKRMEERLETGTMSAFLLNCLCAISARFHSGAGDSPPKNAAPFISKAQELVIPLLQLPTTDSVTGLLLLAWANYGQNSESGLWQYSGMAIRMALDLGLHEVSEIYESQAHVVRTRLLFWSLFVTDRIVAFSTGRPVSISEDIIELPLPTDEDLTPDPARTNEPEALQEPVQSNAFAHLVRLMVLCGRIGNVLNGRRGRVRTLVGEPANDSAVLQSLQTQLVQFYAELPPAMNWSMDAFRHQEARGHGGVFMTLHLWANAVLALVYHPELLMSPSGLETPVSASMDRSLKLSLNSSRLICESLLYADLYASQSYLANPFVTQPIHVACLAFVHDAKMSLLGAHPDQQQQHQQQQQQQAQQRQSQASPGDATRTADLLLNSIARQSIELLMSAIQRMEHYWAGASLVSSILEQKTTGLVRQDVTSIARARKTFISLPDKGLLKRFTGKDLPYNTAPPTETSLRASLVKENAEPYSLTELFNMYSVEGTYVRPADSMDLEGLVTSSYNMGQ